MAVELPPGFPDSPGPPGDVVVVVGRIADWRRRRDLLGAADLPRLQDLAHPATAEAYVAGRALARSAIGRWLRRLPGDVPIVLGREGKPTLPDETPLRFNISHAGEHVALALATGAEIGLDIEPETPPERDAVAEVVMTARELADFRRLPEADRDAAFLRLWTRKEAVLKAAGTGFTVEPRAVTVGVGDLRSPVELAGHPGVFSVADCPIPVSIGILPAAVSLWGPTLARVALLGPS